jgi:phosphoenolpyruvate synthase/pyruvate phosphate dikinase
MARSVERLARIEPLAANYLHDRLRGGGLFIYAAILDNLLADANRLLGIQNTVFGSPVLSGLDALNPGMARGVLHIVEREDAVDQFDPAGIYVLPATTDDLPPVGGILTTGQGNLLSHVQLLARNLGIPNVAISKGVLSRIRSRAEQQVVLAVSPQGVVQLAEDGPSWNRIFEADPAPSNDLIRADMHKINLERRDFIRLGGLRADDSGRVCGPKAANLGELKHFFPEAVADGLVIPFGVFRELLNQPLEPNGPTVFEWMQFQYSRIAELADRPVQRNEAVGRFLTRIQNWIRESDPGRGFRQRLSVAMEQTFGPDGSYGVFVRSDTNVEDLTGFTGAGLNLTLPNVVGVDRVMDAVRRVWASPFSERAYRWRQAYMEKPEHVYVSVLLMKSVPVEKSGVMVTVDVETGSPEWLTIAVNEGVGGAVSGQTAEELRVNAATGRVRLMAQASETEKRVLLANGGMEEVPVGPSDAVLDSVEIRRLIDLAREVPERFPKLRDAAGRPVPADIEFGFYRQKLALFQIRPFLESEQARRNRFLNELDHQLTQNLKRIVDMDAVPGDD